MILVVSHYTKNKGTTDFLIDHLRMRRIPFYYLKHPFYFEERRVSELIYSSTDGKQKVLSKVKKSKKSFLDMVQDFFISLFFSIKLGRKVDSIIGFGSFNLFPFIIFNNFYKRKLFFWGCDYSVKRFRNMFLNKLYFWFETLACKYSTLVIQPTIRQQSVRIEKHNLDIKKSLIIPNGIESIEKSESKMRSDDISLIYIGSITKQHGITEFVKYFYSEKGIKLKLYIFGSGEDEESLVNIIREESLSDLVVYFGSKSPVEIKSFIDNFEGRLFGIAPYDNKFGDHVYYGDSIKIKEYLSYGFPYITSDITYLNSDIKEFGFVYDKFAELTRFLNEGIKNFTFDDNKRIHVLKSYIWYYLLDNFLLKINL